MLVVFCEHVDPASAHFRNNEAIPLGPWYGSWCQQISHNHDAGNGMQDSTAPIST